MTTNHAIKFFLIAKHFRDGEKQLKRGENAYTSGHVKSMSFHGDIEPAILKGEVQASMRNRLYNVEVHIDLKKDEVQSASCTCPRGQVVCHHLAALLYYAHYNISSTDVQRQWGTTARSVNPNPEESVQTIEEMYPPKEQYRAIAAKVTQSKIDDFAKTLGDTNVVGFSWLLKPEADEEISFLVPSIEDIIFSEEYFKAKDKNNYLFDKCSLSSDQIISIAKMTVGQHKNAGWLMTRKNRLTASKFSLVLKACKRNRYPPSLYKQLLEGYDMHRVLAVQWGKDNEATAITAFIEHTALTVIPTGLWLDECGFLGASPDGLIGNNATLEVKCPWKYRNTSLKAGVQDKKYFFYYENDDIIVNKEHPYYAQIQGQLYLTNRQQCYFFVWTPNECECMLIERDYEWLGNLDILKQFYVQKFIPALFN